MVFTPRNKELTTMKTKWVSYFNQCKNFENISDLILCHEDLSPAAKSSTSKEIIEQLNLTKNKGIKAILDWDLPLNENNEAQFIKVLQSLPLNEFDAIRIQDFGALYLLKELNIKTPVHFIAEKSNLNLNALKNIIQFEKVKISRIILNTQIQWSELQKIIQSFNQKIEIEILVCGPLLIYHSPRSLLQENIEEKEIISEEDGGKKFYFTQNKHGTFMYHTKDLYLLNFWEEFQSSGITHLRVNMPNNRPWEIVISTPPLEREKFSRQYPKPIFNGLFGINKTDVLFNRLKNYTQKKEIHKIEIGRVIASEKENYTAIKFNQDINRIPNNILVQNPLGSEFSYSIDKFFTIDKKSTMQCTEDQILSTNFIKKAQVSSIIYIMADDL